MNPPLPQRTLLVMAGGLLLLGSWVAFALVMSLPLLLAVFFPILLFIVAFLVLPVTIIALIAAIAVTSKWLVAQNIQPAKTIVGSASIMTVATVGTGFAVLHDQPVAPIVLAAAALVGTPLYFALIYKLSSSWLPWLLRGMVMLIVTATVSGAFAGIGLAINRVPTGSKVAELTADLQRLPFTYYVPVDSQLHIESVVTTSPAGSQHDFLHLTVVDATGSTASAVNIDETKLAGDAGQPSCQALGVGEGFGDDDLTCPLKQTVGDIRIYEVATSNVTITVAVAKDTLIKCDARLGPQANNAPDIPTCQRLFKGLEQTDAPAFISAIDKQNSHWFCCSY